MTDEERTAKILEAAITVIDAASALLKEIHRDIGGKDASEVAPGAPPTREIWPGHEGHELLRDPADRVNGWVVCQTDGETLRSGPDRA